MPVHPFLFYTTLYHHSLLVRLHSRGTEEARLRLGSGLGRGISMYDIGRSLGVSRFQGADASGFGLPFPAIGFRIPHFPCVHS